MSNQIFQYNSNPITFQLGNGDVMVSATEMAKPFGANKSARFWLSNQSSKEYLSELSKVRNLTLADLVRVNKGGNTSGTWMHEDVALEFARWLSPVFAIWCNDRIKELLKTGVTTITNDDEVIAQAMNVLQKRLEASKAEKEQLAEQNRLQSEQIHLSAPKVNYYNTVLMSESTYNINQIAKELGMSAITLNRKLKDHKIHYKQGGQWLLSYKYQTEGFTKTKTHSFTHSDGTKGTAMQTVWTEAGREFIHSIIK